MILESPEYQLFTRAVELTTQMIEILSVERQEYTEVTKLLVERGNVYKELDNYIKTLDRSKISDKSIVKQKYDELLQLDNDFRALLKVQSERLRGRLKSTKKDQQAQQSYNKPKKSNNSMFISSKLEG